MYKACTPTSIDDFLCLSVVNDVFFFFFIRLAGSFFISDVGKLGSLTASGNLDAISSYLLVSSMSSGSI